MPQQTISEETRATIARAEPDVPFVPETGFVLDEPSETPKKGKKRRGRPAKGKKPASQTAAEPRPAPKPITPVVEGPPPTLVRGCQWMLRNVVTMMEVGYGWDRPDDYEEWLSEASQFGARTVQKYFPDWMAQFGDEILLIAMLLIWVTPNVGKKLRERKESHHRDDRTQGQRQDEPALPFAQSA